MPLSADALCLSLLTLANFRNYEALRLAVDAPFIVLTGPNGGGKTNLLEAISLLAPGRGLRGAAFEEVVRYGSQAAARVAADLSGPRGDIALAATFRACDGAPRRGGRLRPWPRG